MEIEFDLTPLFDEVQKVKYIPIQFLLAKGYAKPNIDRLFTELESKGLGFFYRGKKGRYNSGIFYPADDCPINYKLIIERKNAKNNIFY